MKLHKTLPFLLGITLVFLLLDRPWEAEAEPLPVFAAPAASTSEATLVALQAATEVKADAPTRELTHEEIEQLAEAQRTSAWLFDAMASWTKVPLDPGPGIGEFELSHHDTVEDFVTRLLDIADAVAKAPLFDGKRQALDIVAIGFEESGFRRWVDDGSCNTVTGLPRPQGEWDCDSGRAYTVWQFRPDLWYTTPGEHHVTGADLLADRGFAADKAWEKYDANPRGWATWSKAKALAARWAAKHPAP